MKYKRSFHLCLSLALTAGLGGIGTRCLGQGLPQAAPVRSLPVDHFSIVSGDGSPVSPTVDMLLETIRTKVSRAMISHGLKLSATSQPLVWRCFDDREQYQQYASSVDHASPAFVDAYYSTRNNHVVMHYETLSADRMVVLTHEMTHQLAYNSGLQKRGVMYPLWVSEGLATFFETCALSDAQRAGGSVRVRQLADLGATDRLIPLSELAVMTGSDALATSPSDAYAQYWGLMAFLLDRQPDALNAYLAGFARQPMGRRSPASLRHDFVACFGPIDVLENQWRQFVASLTDSKPTGDPVPDAARNVGL